MSGSCWTTTTCWRKARPGHSLNTTRISSRLLRYNPRTTRIYNRSISLDPLEYFLFIFFRFLFFSFLLSDIPFYAISRVNVEGRVILPRRTRRRSLLPRCKIKFQSGVRRERCLLGAYRGPQILTRWRWLHNEIPTTTIPLYGSHGLHWYYFSVITWDKNLSWREASTIFPKVMWPFKMNYRYFSSNVSTLKTRRKCFSSKVPTRIIFFLFLSSTEILVLLENFLWFRLGNDLRLTCFLGPSWEVGFPLNINFHSQQHLCLDFISSLEKK